MASKAKVNLGLALGGGGARGLAHLGVLQVLEQEGLEIDRLVGTSIGSIVGASYALQGDALELTRRALAYLKGESFKNNPFKKVLFHSDDPEQNFVRSIILSVKKSYVFSSLLRKPSIFPGERLFQFICDLVPDKTFADTRIPFVVPAIDIQSGKEVWLDSGPLRKALLASCSLPGFFPPVEHDGMLLMDAGVISPVPVSPCRAFSPKVTVAVDISAPLEQGGDLETGLDAIMRVEAIAGKLINDLELAKADVVIRPDVGAKNWSDFSDLDEMVESGIRAAREKVPQIRELLAAKPRRRFWKTSTTSA